MKLRSRQGLRNCVLFGLGLILPALAQTPTAQQPQGQQQTPPETGQTPTAPRELPPDVIRPNYTLGPSDQILIRCPQVEEINEKPFRIDSEGYINLPLVGRIRAGGMTQTELETELIRRLKEYVREPQVIISITAFRNEPVFFQGAFVRPGIYPLQGRRTLVEMLIAIGGIQPNASRHITVTRRAEYGAIPLPNAIVDPEKKISTVEISLGSLRENVNPAEDIVLQPYDIISVQRAELVYMTGEVNKVGGIALEERDSISFLQALAQSGGFTREAKKDEVRILRPVLNTNRRAVIALNANRIFEGKDLDFPLLPNDVLYVPHSYKVSVLRIVGQIVLPIIPYLIFIAAQ
jgi:polysaccharide export outer membrane protein